MELSKGFKLHGKALQLIGLNIVLFIIFTALLPARFPTLSNFRSMGFQLSEIGLFTIAIALAMMTGGINLSVVAAGNLSATVIGFYLLGNLPPTASWAEVAPYLLMSVVIATVLGIACGCLNGFLVAYMKIPPILATLGTQNLFNGICMILTKGTGVSGIFPDPIIFIGTGTIFRYIPIPLILFITALIVFYYNIHRRPQGLKTQWFGSNYKVSFYSGINTVKTVFITYVYSTLLGALTGILIIARTSSAKWDYGTAYVLQALLVANLAGIAGGKGNILNIVLSILAVQMVDSGLNFLRINSYVRAASYGILLIISIVLEYSLQQYRQRKQLKRATMAAESTA